MPPVARRGEQPRTDNDATVGGTRLAEAMKVRDVPAELLKCPVCHRNYDRPKLLPCLHTFCQACLQNCLHQSQITNGQAFLCPLCRYECNVPKRGVISFLDNVLSESLTDFSKRKSKQERQLCEGCEMNAIAVRKCVECDDWLCAKCCDMHSKVSVRKCAFIESVGKCAFIESK